MTMQQAGRSRHAAGRNENAAGRTAGVNAAGRSECSRCRTE